MIWMYLLPKAFRLPTRFYACLLAFFLVLGSQPVFSQQPPEGRMTVSSIDTTNFPSINFRVEVIDDAGMFVPNLNFADMQVIEDDILLPLDSLEIVQPGMQIITAFTPSPIFAAKSAGVSNLESLKTHLTTWATNQPSDSPDEFSIATSTGMLAIRLKDPNLWVEALSAYQPDLQQAQPTLVSLSQALDLAADPGTRPGQHRVIFYITALPPANTRTSLEGLIDLAINLSVTVHVIAVSNTPDVPLQTSEPLIRLAESTGGSFFVYTGAETLPDLDAALQPLRFQYEAAYTSSINAPGQHKLQVQLLSQDLPLTSQPATIEIDVQPPNPILLSPPVTINRIWTEPEDRREVRQLIPVSQPIQMLVEFPDGHTRPLASSALYMNGIRIAENIAAPFDSFDLPLTDYTAGTRLLLQVEVVDTLGLTGRSGEVPITVTVAPEPRKFWGDVVTPERALIAGALALAATILVLVLVLSGRRRRTLSVRARRDPVTQPVAINQVKPAKARQSANASPLTDESGTPTSVTIPARLVPLSEPGTPFIENAVPLNRVEIIIGSDASRANRVFEHFTVSPRHCRIALPPNGQISISDCGSTNGTWVNYEQINSGAHPLEHGDLIHIGRMVFRFELSTPPNNRRPVVSPFKEDEP